MSSTAAKYPQHNQIISLILFVIAIFFLSGCSDDTTKKEQTPPSELKNKSGLQTREIPKKAEKLIVGVSADYPPFESMEAGTIVGFDIDLINAIGKHLNLDVEIKDMPFYTIIPSLNSGDINIGISGISKTQERAKSIDFSEAYYTTKLALLKLNSSGFETIKNGMKIGSQTGSVMYQWLVSQKQKGIDIDIIVMDDNLALVEELKNERIDAVLLDNVIAGNIQRKSDAKLSVITLYDAEVSSFFIGLRKGDPLVSDINSALEAIKTSGMLDEMKKKWGL